MTLQIALLLLILVVTLILFALERIPADVVALGVLVVLILTGLVPSDRAFAGLGSDTIIMLFGLLVMAAALIRTGVVELSGRAILRQSGANPRRLLLIVMVSAAILGAFLSNTASTAFFVPIVLGLAHRTRTSPSKLLMPLAFASILTSAVTLVSTSTNIVISGLMVRYDLAPMGMFELAPVGIPIAIAGLIYMFLVGTRMIPDRTPADELGDGIGARLFLTELMILPSSPLIGKKLSESGLGQDLDLKVLRVVRNKNSHYSPRAELELQEGDVLLVEGMRDDILKVKDEVGIDIKADVKLSDPDLLGGEAELVEVILLPQSPLIGRTLKRFRFRERYGLQVLALNRQGETIRRKISQIPLRLGDVLLVQGRRSAIAIMDEQKVFSVVNAVQGARPKLQRAPIAIAIFVGVITSATVGLLSLPMAMLVGALLVLATRCITPEEAYRDVEWKALILVWGMLAFGAAMDHTGAAEYLAGELVRFSQGTDPIVLLVAFFVLTVVLTQPMSNQAAAVVVVPVAIQTALQLNLNPRTFAMMIAVAASCSYLTPLEPSCLMVYGPGRYRFRDFLKVGSLLTVIILVLSVVLVPMIWPLEV